VCRFFVPTSDSQEARYVVLQPEKHAQRAFFFALVAIVGTVEPSGPVNQLLFPAGPDHESHDLFGTLTALP
jgi:hypothetical protein